MKNLFAVAVLLLVQLSALAQPMPPGLGGGEGGTNAGFGVSTYVMPDYGTNLWIAQVGFASGNLTAIASNTLADVSYELQTRSSLNSTDQWFSTGLFITGSETTNWTAFNPVAVSLTNNMFIRLLSWIDSDNVGIPDWWQLEYFGYVGINPYAQSPSGDGFTIWQKYNDGLNPTNFETPPAPAALYAYVDATGTNVLLSWNPAQGAVSGYVITQGVWDWDNDDFDYATVGEAATNAFTDVDGYASAADDDDVYEVTAQYPGGNVSATAATYLYFSPPAPSVAPAPVYNINVSATLIRNGTGRWQLMFAGLPAGAQSVQLLWTDANGNTTTQSISAGVLTNGIYPVPDADAVNFLGDAVSVQGMGAGGEAGAANAAGTLAGDAPYFVDGRAHLKQNLEFLLRAASQERPYAAYDTGYFYDLSATFPASTNFEEFSFLHPDSGFAALDDLWPFEMNYTLANYLVDTARTNSENLPFAYTNFNFVVDFATNVPAPPILGGADPYWIIQIGMYSDGYNPADPANNAADWGVTLTDTNTTAELQSGLYNLFGLPYETGCMIDQAGIDPGTGWPAYPPVYQAVAPGGGVTAMYAPTNGYAFDYYASQCPAPALQLTNYFFAPLSNPGLNPTNLPPVAQQPFPTPLADTFNVTNQTPLIIGAVGQPMIIGGWAKFAIENGASDKFAYLGQYYLTNVFLLDTNGNVTTNSAGVLSPYGEFFPTQAGAAQLVTLPDIDTGQQGTCTVSVVSLNVDANHDGTMDLTWNGPDQTSSNNPYVFWANNNYDRWKYDSDDNTNYQDDVQIQGCPATPNTPTPDCNYSNVLSDGYAYRAIPDTRDLVDFTRLWVCGITTNLLAALPAGSTVTLNWGDVGSPNSGNPTIDLFTAADADGGIGYQTNETIAAEQTNALSCPYVGRLVPGGSIQLNASTFANSWAGNHFIWCGVSNGTGGLNLTITDANSNMLGQATVYIQIQDIKQMYERWTVGDNPNVAPTNTAYLVADGLTAGEMPFQYTPATAGTPYIMFVHGWNMEYWEKDRFAESAFKRLYWQGYQGRFGEFRWPTGFGFTGWQTIATNLTEKDNFDSSEYAAWQSGQGLLNKLNDLNTQYPGSVYLLAHSMGNVVAGEALRLAGSSQVVNTYVASQAAVSAHAYDTNIANYSFYYPPWSLSADTPNIYGNWFAGNSGGGAGQVISFYNVNDFALQRSVWQRDELLKPDQDVLEGTTTWYYGYSGSVSDPAPWNNFYKQTFSGSTIFDFNIVTSLSNRHEVMGYAAQSYTTALGATAGVHHLADSIDLTGVWLPDPTGNDYTEHFYHSAEFRGDNPQQRNYWSELMGSDGFNLK